MDYFIKTTDEATLWEKLIASGVATEQTTVRHPEIGEETIRSVRQGVSLDIIGSIFKPTGQMTTILGPEGSDIEVPELAAIEGFHANLRGILTDVEQEALADILIEAPATPSRVWA